MKDFANAMFIPGDRLLPSPEIIARLKQRDPNAPEDIMARMQRIQDDAHAADRASLKSTVLSTLRSRAFWDGVASAFSFAALAPRRAPAPLSPANGINHAWAQVGNYMRQAIAEYMEAHAIPQSALSAAEQDSLKPLKLDP